MHCLLRYRFVSDQSYLAEHSSMPPTPFVLALPLCCRFLPRRRQVSSVCELFLPRRGRVWKRRVGPRVHATGLKCWVPFPGGSRRTPRVPTGPVPALGQVVNVVRAHSGLQCRFRWYGAISCLFEIFKDGVERLARVRTNRAGLEAPNLVVQACFPNAA